MKIIISPAKKMNMDCDSPLDCQRPLFLEESQQLCELLCSLSPEELQKIWKCNDSLAKLNVERLKTMDLQRNLTPAIFAYEGIQYRYMAPNVLEQSQLDYLQQNLRILSGFYGLLRPFDGVTPYRLEMGAKLEVPPHKNLYQFWGHKLADELVDEGDWVLNLASKEYSRAVQPHLSEKIPFITCVFGELKGDSVIEKGTMCKMARGQMVRWLAENGIENLEDVKKFDQLEYEFSAERSSAEQLVFLRGQNHDLCNGRCLR